MPMPEYINVVHHMKLFIITMMCMRYLLNPCVEALPSKSVNVLKECEQHVCCQEVMESTTKLGLSTYMCQGIGQGYCRSADTLVRSLECVIDDLCAQH